MVQAQMHIGDIGLQIRQVSLHRALPCVARLPAHAPHSPAWCGSHAGAPGPGSPPCLSLLRPSSRGIRSQPGCRWCQPRRTSYRYRIRESRARHAGPHACARSAATVSEQLSAHGAQIDQALPRLPAFSMIAWPHRRHRGRHRQRVSRTCSGSWRGRTGSGACLMSWQERCARRSAVCRAADLLHLHMRATRSRASAPIAVV